MTCETCRWLEPYATYFYCRHIIVWVVPTHLSNSCDKWEEKPLYATLKIGGVK